MSVITPKPYPLPTKIGARVRMTNGSAQLNVLMIERIGS
jgi:hypothetical protein